MKYIKLEWPEIQDYMDNLDYPEECYYDSFKNVWFIPEDWDSDYLKLKKVKENVLKSLMDDYLKLGDDIGDLKDVIG